MDEDKCVLWQVCSLRKDEDEGCTTHVCWQSIDERNAYHRKLIDTWEEMKDKLEDKYLPVDYVDSFDQLVNYTQWTLTVDDYTEGFHDLMVWCKVFENDCQAISKYKRWLGRDSKRIDYTQFSQYRRSLSYGTSHRGSSAASIIKVFRRTSSKEKLRYDLSTRRSFVEIQQTKLHHRISIGKPHLRIKQGHHQTVPAKERVLSTLRDRGRISNPFTVLVKDTMLLKFECTC